MSHPNLTTNFHNSSGYARGAAQIPQANAINDKSCPNLTMNIHSSSGYPGGTAQIPQANDINDKSHPYLTTHSTICQVTSEALPKSHRDAINDMSHPNLTTHIAICQYIQWQVSSQLAHEHPHFFRLCRRRPNYTDKHNQWHGMVQANVGQNSKRNILQVLLNVWFDKYLWWLSVNYT